jgi:hypothetical protein
MIADHLAFLAGINSAILRYVGAMEEEPQSTSLASNMLVESDLVVRVNLASDALS